MLKFSTFPFLGVEKCEITVIFIVNPKIVLTRSKICLCVYQTDEMLQNSRYYLTYVNYKRNIWVEDTAVENV